MNLFKKRSVENPEASRLFQMSNWLAYLSVSEQSRQPYKYHPIFYAAAFATVKNVSRYGMYLEREQKPGERIYDHPVLALLKKPNVFMTWTTFIQAIVCNLLLQPGTSSEKGGQCFILPNSVDADPRNDFVDLWRGVVPLTLFPVNDERIEPTVTGAGQVTGWQHVDGANRVKKYGFNELIRIFQYNPYSILSGLANQHAARYALAFDADANDYNESIMRNSAVPMGFLYSEKPIGDANKKKEILRTFFEMVGGKKRAGSNAILDGGIDYKKIGLTNAEMQFLESRGFSRDLIIAAMGVNKIATGNYEQINYATLVEGRRMLHYDTYMPMADLIAEAINSQWIGYVEPGLKLKFDYDAVDVLKPDLSKPAAAVLNFTNAGAPFALACQISGVRLPADAAKKYPWIEENPKPAGGGGLFLSAPDAGPRALPAPRATEPEEVGLEYWHGYIRRVFEPGEKRYKQTVIDFFNEQRNKLQDLVDAWAEGKKVTREIDLDAEVYFDIVVPETDRLMGKVRPVVKEQMARDALELARQGIKFNVTDERATAVLARREKFLAGLNQLTFKKVLDEVDPLIATGREENWTVGQLARELKPAISRVYEGQKNHAQTVARTEIGAVSSETRFAAMDENGIEYLEWISAGDEDVRESHRAQGEAGSNVVRTGDKFSIVNLRYPCESGGAPEEVINCRCVAVPKKNQ